MSERISYEKVEDQDPKVFHLNEMEDQDLNIFQANERDNQYPVEEQNQKEYFRENKKRTHLDIGKSKIIYYNYLNYITKLPFILESSKSSKKFKKIDFKHTLISEFDKIYDRTKISKDSDDNIDYMLMSGKNSYL